MDNTSCDDLDACTRIDVCRTGACIGLDPVTCEAGDDCHALGACDPTTGVCADPAALQDGTRCSGGACQAGQCEAVDDDGPPHTPYGCGCTSAGGEATPLMALGLLGLLWRSRSRSRRPRLLPFVLFFAVASLDPTPAAAQDPERPTLAFLGITGDAGLEEAKVKAISEFVQTEVGALGVYQVLGQSEIQALLGFEAQRQLMGCAEQTASCLAEIGGALGAGRILVGNLSRVGESLLLNLSLLDVTDSQLINRVGKRVKGQNLEPLLDVIPQMARSLIERDPAVTLTAPVALSSPAPSRRRPALTFSLRADVEPIEPGGMLGVSLGWQPGLFGLVLTAAGHPPATQGTSRPFALRLEGRIAPVEWGPAKPYLTLGTTLFLPTVLARVGLGVQLAFGSLALEIDAAWERVLTDTGLFSTNFLVLGVGVGWTF